MLTGHFCIEHNVQEAIRQEYRLARRHYDETLGRYLYARAEHAERFKDAKQRLNAARELIYGD